MLFIFRPSLRMIEIKNFIFLAKSFTFSAFLTFTFLEILKIVWIFKGALTLHILDQTVLFIDSNSIERSLFQPPGSFHLVFYDGGYNTFSSLLWASWLKIFKKNSVRLYRAMLFDWFLINRSRRGTLQQLVRKVVECSLMTSGVILIPSLLIVPSSLIAFHYSFHIHLHWSLSLGSQFCLIVCTRQ